MNIRVSINPIELMRSVFVLTVLVNISNAGVKETRPGRVLFGALGRVDKKDSHLTRKVMQGWKIGASRGSRPHRRYLVGIDSTVSVGPRPHRSSPVTAQRLPQE